MRQDLDIQPRGLDNLQVQRTAQEQARHKALELQEQVRQVGLHIAAAHTLVEALVVVGILLHTQVLELEIVRLLAAVHLAQSLRQRRSHKLALHNLSSSSFLLQVPVVVQVAEGGTQCQSQVELGSAGLGRMDLGEDNLAPDNHLVALPWLRLFV